MGQGKVRYIVTIWEIAARSWSDQFAARWSNISIRVRTGSSRKRRNTQRLKLWWPSIAVEFLAEELDPMLRSDLYHIHAFVKALKPLVLLKRASNEPVDLVEEAERLFRQGRQRSEDDFRKDLEREFDIRERQIRFRRLFETKGIGSLPHFLPFWLWRIGDPEICSSSIRGLQKAPKYVSEVVERFYFGKAREYQAGLETLEAQPEAEGFRSTFSRFGTRRFSSAFRRVEVVDLPSLPDSNTRLLAANTIIGDEWELARARWASTLEIPPEDDARVPTFIVVDEAHNLIPANPRGKAEAALRELFRTIVAEGRKYGLFLILVSQRPDKLDPLVISECENKIVMKLGSISILNITRQLLGLENAPSRLLEKCLEFERDVES